MLVDDGDETSRKYVTTRCPSRLKQLISTKSDYEADVMIHQYFLVEGYRDV
jgi:hypothetical protein